MSKKNSVPEYTFQISMKKHPDSNRHELSMQSEQVHTVASECESEDMFSYNLNVKTSDLETYQRYAFQQIL